jgi:cytochrome c-type biogenesis protein CcmH/NrfG
MTIVLILIGAAVIIWITLMTLFRSVKFVERKIHQWEEQIQRNPNEYETLAALGSAYGKLGRYEEAWGV